MTDFPIPEQHIRKENPLPPAPDHCETGIEAPARGSRGPAPILLDPEQVLQLARLGATNVEIAKFFNVSEALIRKRYSDIVEAGRTNIKIRLRQAQIREALAGNVTMLIWLGKQMLNQSDQGERGNDDNMPLPWRDE